MKAVKSVHRSWKLLGVNFCILSYFTLLNSVKMHWENRQEQLNEFKSISAADLIW